MLTLPGQASDPRTKALLRTIAPFAEFICFQSYSKKHHHQHTHAWLSSDLPFPELVANITQFRDPKARVTLTSPTLAQSADGYVHIESFNSNTAGFLNYVFGARNFQPFICAAAKLPLISVSKRLKPELARTTSLFKTLNEIFAARKKHQDAQKTVPVRKNDLDFFHVMKTYFADIQLPAFLYASEKGRKLARARHTRYIEVSPAVAHRAVFEDPSSPYFNLDDRRLRQKYEKAARDVSYAETYDYFTYPQHTYARIDQNYDYGDKTLCSPGQSRVLAMRRHHDFRTLELRRRHDLRVAQYVQGTRKFILPPRGIFDKITPTMFLVPTVICVATAKSKKQLKPLVNLSELAAVVIASYRLHVKSQPLPPSPPSSSS